jgi:hypothetical protein
MKNSIFAAHCTLKSGLQYSLTLFDRIFIFMSIFLYTKEIEREN